MIDPEKDIAERAFLRHLLHEGREHLDDLIKEMESPDFDEVVFGCQLSHIYAHLNQAWNGRGKKGSWTEVDFDVFSQFPRDLQPNEGWPPHAEIEGLLRTGRWHIRFHRFLSAIQKPFRRKA